MVIVLPVEKGPGVRTYELGGRFQGETQLHSSPSNQRADVSNLARPISVHRCQVLAGRCDRRNSHEFGDPSSIAQSMWFASCLPPPQCGWIHSKELRGIFNAKSAPPTPRANLLGKRLRVGPRLAAEELDDFRVGEDLRHSAALPLAQRVHGGAQPDCGSFRGKFQFQPPTAEPRSKCRASFACHFRLSGSQDRQDTG